MAGTSELDKSEKGTLPLSFLKRVDRTRTPRSMFIRRAIEQVPTKGSKCDYNKWYRADSWMVGGGFLVGLITVYAIGIKNELFQNHRRAL
jgi:hypothetical protein